jgi:hypothetical protein
VAGINVLSVKAISSTSSRIPQLNISVVNDIAFGKIADRPVVDIRFEAGSIGSLLLVNDHGGIYRTQVDTARDTA